MTRCGDCGVEPGQKHVDGCDVARCTECGGQRITCDHEGAPVGWGQTWTGEWPWELRLDLRCPYCGGDLGGWTREDYGDSAIESIYCNDCTAEWEADGKFRKAGNGKPLVRR